jgi:myo-inositol-1(or 4)-monophosphatase
MCRAGAVQAEGTTMSQPKLPSHTPSNTRALAAAVAAAREAGALMKTHLRRAKQVNESHQHDIKLELDVRCQKLITRTLAKVFPSIPVLGEEGIDAASEKSAARWVVDPIDGTVNFAYGIPHAAVSIALQVRTEDGFRNEVGVVFDPFMDDLWTAIRGKPARLNGRITRVSTRARLDESIVSLGFAKSQDSLKAAQSDFLELTHRVRKIRIMGSAALALTYVACGRFDAYVEAGVRLWDIAAGGLIVECAGGSFVTQPLSGEHRYALIASNGLIHDQIPHARTARTLSKPPGPKGDSKARTRSKSRSQS